MDFKLLRDPDSFHLPPLPSPISSWGPLQPAQHRERWVWTKQILLTLFMWNCHKPSTVWTFDTWQVLAWNGVNSIHCSSEWFFFKGPHYFILSHSLGNLLFLQCFTSPVKTWSSRKTQSIPRWWLRESQLCLLTSGHMLGFLPPNFLPCQCILPPTYCLAETVGSSWQN